MRVQGLALGSALLLGFVALVVSATGPSLASAQGVFTCNGLIPTITGSGNIQGTAGDDVIFGSAGDDVINGGSGNDTICGAGGNDSIDGGSGIDQMWGEVQGAKDTPLGAAGNDYISGGSGDDLLVDPAGVGQVLDAGSGVDRIIGNGQLLGGSGADSITFTAAGAIDPSPLINAGSGTDTCVDNTGLAVKKSCEL